MLVLCAVASLAALAAAAPRSYEERLAVVLDTSIPAAERHRLAIELANEIAPPEPAYDSTYVPKQRRAGAAASTPTQVHLVLAESFGTSIRVNWVTETTEPLPPVVRFSTAAAGDLAQRATGIARTYTEDDMCGASGGHAGWTYDVVLADLQPATRYIYVVGSDASGVWSQQFSFVSPPAAGAREVSFLAYGDNGGPWAGAGQRTMALMAENEVDFAAFSLLIGDLSYADGRQYYWDDWGEQIEPLAARMPFFVTNGNHEFDDGECSVPYYTRFRMPDNGYGDDTSDQGLWYSFEYGPVKFVHMSTEYPFVRGTPQHNFLVQALNDTNRSRTPWLVFTMHRPMYGGSCDSICALLRSDVEPELIRAKVDLALQAHIHNYQRWCAMEGGRCVTPSNNGVFTSPAAPVHLLIGMAGRSFSTREEEAPKDLNVELTITRMGYTRMMANETTFTVELVAESDSRVYDTVVIRK
eukprot:TRINITY_DN1524_c0_g1_i2.p1 TRINITY_DN1524_c0_g1~~TRINITY_DN1524_c0_g1_i2.p1  ORF type:complete len:476 (-),score=113.37 TRINITY_DN1524_c0_g1_i2:40-1446(-)